MGAAGINRGEWVVGYWILVGGCLKLILIGAVGMSRGSGSWQILRGVKGIHRY